MFEDRADSQNVGDRVANLVTLSTYIHVESVFVILFEPFD